MVIRIGSAKCRCPVAASSPSALTLRNRTRTRREPFSLFLSSASSALRNSPRAFLLTISQHPAIFIAFVLARFSSVLGGEATFEVRDSGEGSRLLSRPLL